MNVQIRQEKFVILFFGKVLKSSRSGLILLRYRLNCTKKIETRGLIMAAPVTREKVFKIIFLFISSFKSYVNSEHKVATLLKKTFFKKTQRFFAYFSVCMYSCMFFCTPRAVPEMYTISESLSLKKNHNLWHCSALQDNFFLCASSSVPM